MTSGMSQGTERFQMIKDDPYLEPFEESIVKRYQQAQTWIKNIEEAEGSLDAFSKGYEKYGFHIQSVRTAMITIRK